MSPFPPSEGNLASQTQTSGGTQYTTFSYDDRNRLTGVTIRASSGGSILHQATYTYDALDRRIGFNDDGTQTWVVWDKQNPYADFSGSTSSTVTERYLYGPAVDALLARTDSGGNTAWYLTDHLGTVRDIANSSGSVIDHVAYDSFGNGLSESSPASGDRFKFTGRELDSATGLYCYRERYYQSSQGRFTSQDPSGFQGAAANLYSYCEDQPINGTDPVGLFDQKPLPGLGPLPNPGILVDYISILDLQDQAEFQKILAIMKKYTASQKIVLDELNLEIQSGVRFQHDKNQYLNIVLNKGYVDKYIKDQGQFDYWVMIRMVHECIHVADEYENQHGNSIDEEERAWAAQLMFYNAMKQYIQVNDPSHPNYSDPNTEDMLKRIERTGSLREAIKTKYRYAEDRSAYQKAASLQFGGGVPSNRGPRQ